MLNKNQIQKNKGISLIIALFTITLLLALSLSIGNIIVRQSRIINTSVSSQLAFYAADSALECAIYWDIISDDGLINKVNPETSEDTYVFNITYPDTANTIKCGPAGAPKGFTKNIETDPDTAEEYTKSSFYLDYSTSEYSACAFVNVRKYAGRTYIDSRGYNTGMGTDSCDLTNAVARRIVERGLEYTH